MTILSFCSCNEEQPRLAYSSTNFSLRLRDDFQPSCWPAHTIPGSLTTTPVYSFSSTPFPYSGQCSVDYATIQFERQRNNAALCRVTLTDRRIINPLYFIGSSSKIVISAGQLNRMGKVSTPTPRFVY